MMHSALALFAQRTRIPTSARSIGFYVSFGFVLVRVRVLNPVPPRGGGSEKDSYLHIDSYLHRKSVAETFLLQLFFCCRGTLGSNTRHLTSPRAHRCNPYAHLVRRGIKNRHSNMLMDERPGEVSGAPRGSSDPEMPSATVAQRSLDQPFVAQLEQDLDHDSSSELHDGSGNFLDESYHNLPEDTEELKKALLEARAEIQRLRRDANGTPLKFGALNLAAIQEHEAATATKGAKALQNPRNLSRGSGGNMGGIETAERGEAGTLSSPAVDTRDVRGGPPSESPGPRMFNGGDMKMLMSLSDLPPAQDIEAIDISREDRFPGDSSDEEVHAAESGPLQCAVISDPGEDLDDEMAMVMLRYLIGRGYVECKGVITNLKPSADRARLMRGTLDTLGLWEVPVGYGTDGGSMLHEETFCASAASYMPAVNSQRAGSILPGRALLQRIFTDATSNSIAVICISSLKDVALFLRDNTALFISKCHSITIMGGVEDFDEDDNANALVPDTAQNNTFDMEASKFLFARCQQLGVPLIVLSRHAAYACPVSRQIYDTMQKTNNPIAGRLKQAQRSSIENLWNRARAPVGDASRMGLPPRCDVPWFQNTFCGGAIIEGASCWPYIQTFNMYDPLALIVAVPALRERFFESKNKTFKSVTHQVLGASKELHGVREPPALHHFMLNAFFQGITADLSTPEEMVIITDAGQDPDDEMALVLTRHLTELRLVKCLGVIANLRPAAERARLVRGTLDSLGLNQVPVGVGTDGGSSKHTDTFSATASEYMPTNGKQIHLDGQALMKEIYEEAGFSSITLLCISSLTDAAQFLRDNETLFVQKTKSVTIQGGVQPFEEGAFLEPDSAQNNVFDKEASAFFYRRCQELGIPMAVISRFAAAQCPISRSIYDRMASVGNPIGQRLKQYQEESLQHLWQRAVMPVDAPERLSLPARCDKKWFLKTFCADIQAETVPNSQDIWPFVKTFQLYDPMALLASVPSLRHRHFTPKICAVNGTQHFIFGVTAEEHGVQSERAKDLTELMYHSFLKAMTAELSNFKLPKWTLGKTRDAIRLAKRSGGVFHDSKSSAESEASGESGSSSILSEGYGSALFLGDEPAAIYGHEIDTPYLSSEDKGGCAFFNFDDMLESLLAEAKSKSLTPPAALLKADGAAPP